MQYSEIELTVKDILADKLDMDRNKINLNSDLFNELGLDSFGSIEIVFELEEKFDIKILEADIEKAKRILDYKPKVDLEEGLLRTIHWYRNNLLHD